LLKKWGGEISGLIKSSGWDGDRQGTGIQKCDR